MGVSEGNADLTDYTSDELDSVTNYTIPNQVAPVYSISEPNIAQPQSVADDVEAVIDRRNIILTRHRKWAVVDNWKSRNVTEAYGPTVIPDPNFMLDGLENQYPYGYIKYKNVLAPSGSVLHILPAAVSPVTVSATITPFLPSGLSLNASTFAISGIPTVVQESARYTVIGSDLSGNTVRTRFTIEIYNPANAASIVYPLRNIAATGVAYTLTPTTWVIPSGATPSINPSLPSSLTFISSTGVVSGTPTTAQPRRVYTVRCNGIGNISDVTFGDAFTLAVTGTGSPSALYSFTTTSIPLGVSRTITPTTWAGIGAATISPTLPTGLSFTSATGVISGTPSVAGAPKIYTVAYSGAGAYTSIADTLNLTFNVCSVTNSTPSGYDWEIEPITTSASDWGNDLNGTFSGLFKVTDYRVSPPSSVTLLCGKTQNRHPIKYCIQNSTNYRCNIFLRNGSYPGFIIDNKSSWYSIYKTGGVKGVRLIGESIGGVKINSGGVSMYIHSLSGATGSTTVTPGAMRDISFSSIYFSGTSGLGVKGLFIQPNVSSVVVPGLHFYDCTFDGRGLPTKWLFRDYNAIDRRFIRCNFYDNWAPAANTVAVEHAYYNSFEAGNNFFINCLFSGIGRNAIQAANYKSYSTDQNTTNYSPRSQGSWTVSACSAIQCGMASWTLNNGTPQYNKNSYGSVYYTFAGVSATYLLNSIASGGYHTVQGYEFPIGTGALVIWKNPNTVGVNKATDPEFYGNKIAVVSGCNFDMRQSTEFDLVNIKNVRQLWVSGGTYRCNGKSPFQLSSHAVGQTIGNEEQGYNPNNLPYIASSFLNFPLNSTTFPAGYPTSIKANCLPFSNCQVLSQVQFEALVNAADQPIPTLPTKPTDGSFLYEAGFTHPVTGITYA